MLMTRVATLHDRWQHDHLVRNSAFLMLTTVLNGAIGYVYWIVAARIGEPDDIGIATSLIAVLFLTSMATNLGLGHALIQALPKVARDDRRWSVMVNTGVLAGLAAGVAGSGVAVAVLPSLVPELADTLHRPFTTVMFVLGAGLFTATLILDCVFVSERRGGHMLGRNGVFAIGKLGLLAAPALLGRDIDAAWIVSSFVLGSALSLAAGLGQLHGLDRRYRRTLTGARGAWGELRGSLASHHLTWFGQNLPQYVLPSVVVAQLTATDNAFFSMAWTVGGVFFMVSPAVAGALFVENAATEEGLARGTRKSLALIAGLLGPAMLVFVLFGGQIMGAFGDEYTGSTVTLLRLLVLSAIPDAVTNVYTAVLRVRRRLRLAAALNLSIAMLALVGSWVLLPAHGIVGVGWAWIGAQVAGCGVVAASMLADRGPVSRQRRSAIVAISAS